jgi:Lar family restriction alleviation protein
METLRPCPFCGGKAKINSQTYANSNDVGFRFDIICLNCGAKLNKSYIVKIRMIASGEIDICEDARQKAIDRWNGVKNEGGN